MNVRVVVAALIAGLVVFVWSAVSHMALPLGEMGISALPNEPEVAEALAKNLPQSGLYLFPVESDPAKMEQAYAQRPHGLLSYSPPGGSLDFTSRLLLEAGTNLAGALLVVFLLASSTVLATWRSRLLAGATVGAFTVVAVEASYGIWYDFPTAYITAQLIDQAVGWALALGAAGWWLHRR